jgi:hypothetical protein
MNEMEIIFNEEDKNALYKPKNRKTEKNFLVRLLLRLGFTKKPKLARQIGMIMSIIIIIIFIISILKTTAPDKIDDKYYFDPTSTVYDSI